MFNYQKLQERINNWKEILESKNIEYVFTDLPKKSQADKPGEYLASCTTLFATIIFSNSTKNKKFLYLYYDLKYETYLEVEGFSEEQRRKMNPLIVVNNAVAIALLTGKNKMPKKVEDEKSG